MGEEVAVLKKEVKEWEHLTAEVKTLQQMLNNNGFSIVSTGPGSKGNETTMFGAFTREALRKFQCAKQIVCDGTEAAREDTSPQPAGHCAYPGQL